jgi:VanZ family protein
MYLCTIPGSRIPSSPFFEKVHMDKIVHLTLFGATVLLLCLGYYWQNRHVSTWALVLIAAFSSLYGLAIEYIQKYWAVGRSFDMTDWAADTIGAILGIIAFHLVRKWWLRPSQGE